MTKNPGDMADWQKTGRELGTRRMIKKYDSYIKLYILKVYPKASFYIFFLL